MYNIRMNVIGIGTAACDYVGIIPHYPRLDDKIKMEHLEIQGGGPVATALVTLSRLGIKTFYAGVLGDDNFGDFILKNLHENNINTDFVQIEKGIRSPFAFCVAHVENGKRSVFSIKGDKMEPDLSDDYLKNIIETADFFHIDGSVPDLSMEVLRQRKNIPVMIDLGAIKPKILDIMPLCEYRIASYQFAREFTGNDKPDIKSFLVDIFDKNTILSGITLGEHGSTFYDGKAFLHIDSFKVEKIKDTTGCGDVFHGAFIYGLLMGWETKKIGRFSSFMAAEKAKHLGGQKGIPKLKDIDLKNIFKSV
ncbi:MAG: hypothetical protein C0601_01245 [Candidatus Muiribacterium halophilum]|uniref:Carbohydrate kinase PfkB domain-containing protein n=1 Tax=Muiribacterium halophilum TaxID=2053465 RepID=A0A2N5ZM10_MUIH1|nr:MAG: hypothetical protein C0601_01245 [Candidatus Muirbacterium halophilum]